MAAPTIRSIAFRRGREKSWRELAERWSDKQLMDLVFTVGQYVMTCMALKTFGVQREPGVPGLPGPSAS